MYMAGLLSLIIKSEFPPSKDHLKYPLYSKRDYFWLQISFSNWVYLNGPRGQISGHSFKNILSKYDKQLSLAFILIKMYFISSYHTNLLSLNSPLQTLSVNFAQCTNILCITMSSRTQNLQIFIFRHMGKKAIRAKNVKNEELT